MRLERRSCVKQSRTRFNLRKEEILNKTKPFIISKDLVMTAYKLVKANAGAAGVDRQSLNDFDKNLKGNLYKLWNRLSSGSYFPPPVKAVAIPKKQGGVRILGIPTVSDRIAQMVVKLIFEPLVEPHFLPDSYGYRPNKSALDAIGITRERCWRYNWVLEYDIKGLFDNIDHELLMKAVRKHTNNKWVILYIERWLKAPMMQLDGSITERTCGTPQGGVISPVLSNVFLHYAFDVWMRKNHPLIPWCRYADDALAHCKTEREAQQLLGELRQRFKECKLELHPDKTKIVYCKDERRKSNHPNTEFTFLGYTFSRRLLRNRHTNGLFMRFVPAASKSAVKSMRAKTRKSELRNKTELSLEEIAKEFNLLLRGWINYYGRYHRSALTPVLVHFNRALAKWARQKFKGFKGSKKRVLKFLENEQRKTPNLFAHWKIGVVHGSV